MHPIRIAVTVPNAQFTKAYSTDRLPHANEIKSRPHSTTEHEMKSLTSVEMDRSRSQKNIADI